MGQFLGQLEPKLGQRDAGEEAALVKWVFRLMEG